jgi:hypothetical protein
MKTALKFFIFTLCVLFGLSGCFDWSKEINWVKAAHPSLDEEAKTFVVRTGESNIYIISDFSVGHDNAIFLDAPDKRLQKRSGFFLDHNQYQWLRVEPGNRQLEAVTGKSTISLTTEPEKNYFLRLTMRGGFWTNSPEVHWEIIGEGEGRGLVLKRELAGEWHHGR